MAISGCESEYEKMRNSLAEYMRLESKYRDAGPPLATTPIDQQTDIRPYILTSEKLAQLRDLRARRDEAAEKWMQACAHYQDCARRRREGP